MKLWLDDEAEASRDRRQQLVRAGLLEVFQPNPLATCGLLP